MKKEVFDGNNFFLPTYKPLEIDIVRGEGIYLFDKSGTKYYDFFFGFSRKCSWLCPPENN